MLLFIYDLNSAASIGDVLVIAEQHLQSVKAFSAAHIVLSASRMGVGKEGTEPGCYIHSAKSKGKGRHDVVPECLHLFLRYLSQDFHWEGVVWPVTKEDEYFWSTWMEQKGSWCDVV